MSPGAAPFLKWTGRSGDVGLLSAIMQLIAREKSLFSYSVIFPISQTCGWVCVYVYACMCVCVLGPDRYWIFEANTNFMELNNSDIHILAFILYTEYTKYRMQIM